MPKLDFTPPAPAGPDSATLWQRFARLVGLTNGQLSAPLPLDEATKVWRKAMVANHPDRGGDPAVAAEINAAWQEVRETL